jgi:hypothetical protein
MAVLLLAADRESSEKIARKLLGKPSKLCMVCFISFVKWSFSSFLALPCQ